MFICLFTLQNQDKDCSRHQREGRALTEFQGTTAWPPCSAQEKSQIFTFELSKGARGRAAPREAPTPGQEEVEVGGISAGRLNTGSLCPSLWPQPRLTAI